MHSNDKNKDSFLKKLESIRNPVIKITFAFIGVGFYLSEFSRIQKLPFNLESYAYLALLACLGILIASWYWSTENDLKVFDTWLHQGTWTPPTAFKERLMATGVSLVVILLMFAARDPLMFGIVLFIYQLYDIFVTKYVEKNLKEAIRDSRSTLEKSEKSNSEITHRLKAILLIEDYFFRVPHLVRRVTLVIFGLVGVVLSILGKQAILTSGELYAYINYILCVIIGEAVISYWRIRRDNKLRNVELDLLK